MSMLSTYSCEGTSDTHILLALVFLPEMAYRDATTDVSGINHGVPDFEELAMT